MGLAQHRDYFSLLEKLEPIYDAIIWKSSAPALRQHQAVLTKFAKKADLNRMFAATEKFYHGAWPKGVPFSFGHYPVPYLNGFKNYTISQSIGSIEERGVLIGSQNLDASESFGVIFHELCHSVYNTQPVEFMQAMGRWFASSSSPSRLQAQNWFNEANSFNSKAASQAASNPLATLVLQFSTADLKKIDEWTAPYPHLQKQSEIIGHIVNRSIFTTVDDNFRVYIVIIANTIKDFSDGVEEMVKVKTFNDKTPSHTF